MDTGTRPAACCTTIHELRHIIWRTLRVYCYPMRYDAAIVVHVVGQKQYSILPILFFTSICLDSTLVKRRVPNAHLTDKHVSHQHQKSPFAGVCCECGPTKEAPHLIRALIQ